MSVLGSLKRLIPDRSPVRLAWHQAKSLAAGLRYGFPARRLRIIGITGTDGKTTTVAMTVHILDAAAIPAGAVSTSFFRIRGKTEENPTHKTSLSPFALQAFLRRCVHEGCSVVVVECSSHGLVQHRLDFLFPEVAAITNTSPEHLDYHGTMEQYRHDKAILFRMLRGKGTKILNKDDGTYEAYLQIPSEKRITWNESAADIHLQIPGAFNIENARCALACAVSVGVDPEKAKEALKTFPGVPGRMEKIDEGQPFGVYVDFTVTPASYEKTLTSLREILPEGKRLLVLTGSCGNRMPEKRPVIGNIVSDLADVVVVSEDETITEDPLKIIDEIWMGIDQSKTDARKIPDRREAIEFLLESAEPGDIVALCGMGACTTMQTLKGLRPWDEREVAKEILRTIH